MPILQRRVWVVVHRWAGLYLAAFVVVAGLTGSVLAFLDDMEDLLNPQNRVATTTAPELDPFTLREIAMKLVTNATVNSVPLHRRQGRGQQIWFAARRDPVTQAELPLDVVSLFLDPFTGRELSRRVDGYWPLTRQNLLGFVYSLHYSFACGAFGLWLFGIAAIVWTVDCFVGFFLTLPRLLAPNAPRSSWWKRWLPSWQFVIRGTPFRINFNLHRASGLWIWPMLVVFAWSAVAFNLGSEVYIPVMKTCFGWKDDPLTALAKLPQPKPDPTLGWREARQIGRRLMAAQARTHGLTIQREDVLSYDPERGVFYYGVVSNRDLHDRYGGTTVALDATTGSFLGLNLPTGENGAQTFTAWICALHAARPWGRPYQAFVCFMGLVVSMLSITGVYLWWKKRRTANPESAIPPHPL